MSKHRYASTSDADGVYEITDVAAGRYRMVVEVTDHIPFIRDDIRLEPAETTVVDIDMERQPRRAAAGCDTCPHSGLILGKAVDRTTGEPLADARVSLPGRAGAVVTGDDGLFSFAAVDSGAHRLTVTHTDYHADSAATVTVARGAVARPTVELRPLKDPAEMTGSVTGTVVDSSTDSVLQQATVSLLNTDHSTLSDSLGGFSLKLVPPGSYTLLATKWGYESSVVSRVVVREKEQTTVGPRLAPRAAGMDAGASGEVAGTVTTDSGGVFENAIVFIRELGNATLSDALGAFTIEDIPSGIYTVAAFAEGYDTAEVSGVDVWQGEVARVQLQLRKAAEPPDLAGRTAIAGLVVDAEEGVPLGGVAVKLEDTDIKGVTDLSGTYALTGLKPGAYTLQASHDGYVDAVSQELTVENGRVTRADLALSKTDLKEMERVAVRGVGVRNTDAALLKERQQAFTVSDAIGAQEISRAGASTAADAVKMVTGATIVDGKYVYIRGLGGRYVNVTLDGIELPSADPDRKAVNLDIFPSGLLDNLNVIKTFSPDLSANFTGGTVNIGTRSLPERPSLALSGSVGMNTKTSFRREFLTYEGGDTDWLGIDDGTRGYPADLDERHPYVPSYGSALTDPDSAYLLDEISKQFGSIQMYPDTTTAPPDYKVGLSAGNTFSLGDQALGLQANVIYSRKFRSYDDGHKGSWKNPGSAADRLAPQRLSEDHKSETEVLWGSLTNVGYKLSEDHSLNLTHMLTRSGIDVVQSLVTTDHTGEFGDDVFLQARRLHFSERGINFSLLRGEHTFGRSPKDLDWRLSFTRSTQDEPDFREYTNKVQMPEEEGDTARYTIPTAGLDPPIHFWRQSLEDAYVAGVSFRLPFYQWRGEEGVVETGGSFDRKTRAYSHKLFVMSLKRYTGHPETYFTPQHFGIIDSVPGVYYQFGSTVGADDDTSMNYTAYQNVWSGFALCKLPVTSRFSVVAGGRFESYTMQSRGWDRSDTLTRVDDRTVDFFPSVSTILKLIEAMNIRAAYARTTARPTFREKSPVETQPFPGGPKVRGDTKLQASYVDNVDLRWEWFLNPGEVLAVSGFYKNIFRPIEITYDLQGNNTMKWNNVPEAYVFGAELEARASLGHFHEALGNFTVGGNLTLASSGVDLDSATLASRRYVDPKAKDTRPLQGQSPYVINFQFSYSNEDVGTNVGVFFNIFGKRMSSSGKNVTPDIYEMPYPSLNVTFSQQVGKRVKIKTTVKDILDAPNEKAHLFKGDRFVSSRNYRGLSASLSASIDAF